MRKLAGWILNGDTGLLEIQCELMVPTSIILFVTSPPDWWIRRGERLTFPPSPVKVLRIFAKMILARGPSFGMTLTLRVEKIAMTIHVIHGLILTAIRLMKVNIQVLPDR